MLIHGQHLLKVHHLLNTVSRSFSSLKEGGRSEFKYISFFPLLFPLFTCKVLCRDEEVLDNLVNHVICTDFALKSMIGEAELLIFTSLQLPQNLHSESKTICLQRIMPCSNRNMLRLMFIYLLVLLNLQDCRGNLISGEFSGDSKVLFLLNLIIMFMFKPIDPGRVYLQTQATPRASTSRGVQ